jgi:hypothetical protein
MNGSHEPDRWWGRCLDAISTGFDVIEAAGEILGFLGRLAGSLLSALLDVLGGF